MNTRDKIIDLLTDKVACYFTSEDWEDLFPTLNAELGIILYESKEEIESFNKAEQMDLIAKFLNEIQTLKFYFFMVLVGIIGVILLIIYLA